MIRIVLADDEKIALKTLKKIIDWERLGLSLVGEAVNGCELYGMITEKCPDIVITDISMPGEDGLKVIAGTIEAGVTTKYIITSAYANFEYARTAMQLGVEDFLPKPVRKSELNQLLERVVGSLDKKEQVRKECSCIIKAAREFIENNYQLHLMLEEVAAACFVSPNYLSTLFHREMGQTFSEYVTETRLNHAYRLLDNASLSVSEVSKLVGYKDVGHFNQIFQKKYGVSPAKYRKNS